MYALQQAAEPFVRAGRDLLHRGLFSAAGEQFHFWLALVESTGQPRLILPALVDLAQVAEARQHFDAALDWLDRAAPLTADPGVDRHDRIRTMAGRMRTLARLGRFDDAGRTGEMLHGLVKQIQDPQLYADVCLDLARLFIQRQEWTAGRHWAESAGGALATFGDVKRLSTADWLVGVALVETGSSRARRWLTDALQRASASGARTAPLLIQLGRLALMQGDLNTAWGFGQPALDELCKEIGVLDKEEVADASMLLGVLFGGTGERNLALRYLNRAAAYYSQLGRVYLWRNATRRIAHALKVTTTHGFTPVRDGVHRLDLLTGLLDLTDDMEAFDPHLRGQSERVAWLAVLLGRAVGLPEPDVHKLQHAGRLHDVGMVAIDSEILHKAGQLTPLEWRRVQVHPLIGEELTRPLGLSADVLAAIRHHHERYDGSGYPSGLAGDDIPVLARILSVSDVYDALTSTRVHRNALSHTMALAQLRKMAGGELDPQLVERFVQMHFVEGVTTPC